MAGPFAAYEIRSHAGGAAPAKLNTTMAVDALSFTLQAGQGASYPDGSGGPFHMSLDAAAVGMEHVRVSTRSGDTFNINSLADRGLMGTTPLQHSQGAAVTHGWSALESDEVIATAHNTLGQIRQRGDMLYADSAGTMAAFTKGTTGQSPVYQADSSVAAGNPIPAAHTHVPADIIGLSPGLIATTRHSYGGSTTTSITGGTSAVHPFDPTNATITFVAPASGKVWIPVTAALENSGAGATVALASPVFVTHNTTTVVSTVPTGGFGGPQGFGLSGSGQQSIAYNDVITGLSAGTTYSWDFAMVVQNAVTVYLCDLTIAVFGA